MTLSDPNRKELLFLTGFMGSGKSTIGPILANTIGYDFVDIDTRIEKYSGKMINEIFRTEGEEKFRTLERNLLAEICKERRMVVSLGGGTIVDPTNRALIAKSGILVYLKMDTDQLLLRLRNKTNRPMLANRNSGQLDEEELRTRLIKLLRKREPFYEKADLIVSTEAHSIGITVDEIVRKLASSIG